MGEDPKVNGWALGAAAGKVLMDAARPPFEPSARQIAFRTHVMACWKKKTVLPHRWLELTTDASEALTLGIPPWSDAPVTASEYGRWVHDNDFNNWLHEEILPVLEPGSVQRKMADLIFYEGVIAAMAKGEDWAYRVWQTRIDHEKKGVEGLPSEGADALEAFLTAADKADAWKIDA